MAMNWRKLLLRDPLLGEHLIALLMVVIAVCRNLNQYAKWTRYYALCSLHGTALLETTATVQTLIEV